MINYICALTQIVGANFMIKRSCSKYLEQIIPFGQAWGRYGVRKMLFDNIDIVMLSTQCHLL